MSRNASKVQQRKSRFGPYARVYTGRSGMQFGITKLDRRTKEAEFLQVVRTALLQQVGPNAAVAQLILVDRAAILSLRLAQIDRRILADRPLTVLDNNQIVAWQNCLTRVLKALDANKPPTISRPTLASILAEVSAE